eukprot:scaffold28292_cov71-Cyclotella_meneghiniana.AAC.4
MMINKNFAILKFCAAVRLTWKHPPQKHIHRRPAMKESEVEKTTHKWHQKGEGRIEFLVLLESRKKLLLEVTVSVTRNTANYDAVDQTSYIDVILARIYSVMFYLSRDNVLVNHATSIHLFQFVLFGY